MKLQNMTIIFIIIIIPVTLILSAYIGTQIDTAVLQQQYDTKLMDATHDAIIAFQANTIHNKYSNNADSIRRDIKAAINTFSTSLAANLGMSGSNSSYIMPYIPALVFTLYDGYYIYSPNEYNYEENGETKTGYQHILKPYIHYTMRYKDGNSDIVVNYTLDNYITIYGNLAGEGYIAKSGYLINIANTLLTEEEENLEEIKESKDKDGNSITSPAPKKSNSASKYYQEACEFTKWVKDKNLQALIIPENAKKSDGTKYTEFANHEEKILKTDTDNDPEKLDSIFNQHKREVMKMSIQENLNNAIAVYNEHSPSMGTHANFQMPILTDLDWEKLLTNVNMISFMEGIPIGAKIYNNYAIVTSTQNKQYVDPEFIYFVDNTNTYHKINCPVLKQNVVNNGSFLTGYKSIDFTRMKTEDGKKYYYKHPEIACYTCIVNALDEKLDPTQLDRKLFKAYYYAVARERYDLDRVTKMLK